MDSFWVMIIPGLISVWNMIIFRTFFQQLPKGLEDSAKIDGCGYWGTFFRIILPLSGPVIATLSLFTAVGHWNDWFMPSTPFTKYFWTIIVTTNLWKSIGFGSSIHQALIFSAARLAEMTGVTGKSLSMAIMMVATLPIVMVYPFVQKYFVKGVLIGSLKD